MKQLTEFRQHKLVTESGEVLGHLRDIRCRSAASGARSLDAYALVYGKLGWLQRMGLRDAATEVRAWSDVVRIEGDRIVVRDASRQGARRARKRYR